MRNYRFLTPVLLVVMLVASVYMLYDKKMDKQNTLDSYVNAARAYREQGIAVDAETNYLEAVELQPTLELYVEIAEFYDESNLTRKARKWCELMLEQYPDKSESYEYMLDQYIKKEDYIECFNLLDTMHDRGISSSRAELAMEAFEYQYYFATEHDDVGVFGAGYCPVMLEGRWGYVDMTGKQNVSARFVKAGPFSGELAPVKEENGDAYFIDPKGNKKVVVLNVEHIEELGLIENNLFALYNGQVWGFYNSDGTHVFGEYKQTTNIGNGLAAVMSNDKWEIVDAKGNVLTGKTYNRVITDEKGIIYRNNRFFADSGSGFQMMDTDGNVYGENYEDAKLFADATYAAVKTKGKWAFADKNGRIQIELDCEDARSFSNGLAAVKIDGKWGFVDMTGKIVIDPQFEDAKDFSPSGTVYVDTGKEWELLVLYKYNH